ncbi:MAG: IclR family transcriptional regulator [Pseudomonadota bacterium]
MNTIAHTPTAAATDRKFVTALARGLDVLRALSAHPKGLGNTALAKATNLPKPTIARLTHTLIELGYVRFDTVTGTYCVTPKLLALGANAADRLDIAALAGPELAALRDGPNPGITASLVEIVGARVVFRSVAQSRQQNALWMQAGIMAHVLETAVGRAMLAASDPPQQEQLLEAIKAVDPREDDTVLADFHTGQAEFKTQGYCTGFGHWRADVNAIAVPVRVPGGMQVCGISVGGPTIYVSREELLETYATLLKAAASRISGDV